MEARLARAALVVAALLSCGAGARSQNFIVSAQTPQLAAEICTAAENFRRDLAIEWLGTELPPWSQPCPIRVQVAPQLGAGGKTSFVFHQGVPMQWSMEVFGSHERVLDSVLPHEVTHTIFATHFGRPLPRWADEGACTTVEHPSEREKQHRLLLQYLTRKPVRSIPFNAMFAMTEYPDDILPLYSQGYSLTRWLIAQGGKPKFINYIGEGMATNNWTAATEKHYGYKNLSQLQVTWLGWVQQGSPEVLASNAPAAEREVAPVAAQSDITGSYTKNVRPDSLAATYSRPAAPTNFEPTTANAAFQSQTARPVSGGWYASRRDQMASEEAGPTSLGPEARSTSRQEDDAAVLSRPTEPLQPIVRAQSPESRRQVLLEWSRPANQPWSKHSSQGPSYVAGERGGGIHR